MSYSFSTSPINVGKDSIRECVGYAFNKFSAAGQAENGTLGEAQIAVNYISKAAVVMVEALGDNAEIVSISVSGHANPGNLPKEGWSNEFCSLTVSVKKYRE